MIYFLAAIGAFLGYIFGAIFNFVMGPFAVPALLIILVALVYIRRKREE
jgi:CBS-domain-containing membrane protein